MTKDKNKEQKTKSTSANENKRKGQYSRQGKNRGQSPHNYVLSSILITIATDVHEKASFFEPDRLFFKVNILMNKSRGVSLLNLF